MDIDRADGRESQTSYRFYKCHVSTRRMVPQAAAFPFYNYYSSMPMPMLMLTRVIGGFIFYQRR
jgi:hypothetical protein